MSTFKRCRVIMLPTEKESKIGLNKHSRKLYFYNPAIMNETQHLYILSDEEIKEGDWYYLEELGNIQQLDKFPFEGEKVIATTNKSLELPEPSEGFIRDYIEAYNNGNPITEVDVEYEEFDWNPVETRERIKVNSKDNTITIRKIKDSWNREEIYKLMNKAIQWGRNANNYQATQQEINNWIKQNL